MAFSTRVAPAVLKAIRNPVICANVARKARRGKFSRDIFLPFNIDIGGWPFDCLYQWNTTRFPMHGMGWMEGMMTNGCYWSFINYERVPPLHFIFFHSIFILGILT